MQVLADLSGKVVVDVGVPGTVDVLPEGLTKIEWLPPSRSSRQPFCSK
jgi:hypothetical protein